MNDIEISPEQVKRIQNLVNDHTWWLNNIMQCGSNWNHQDRMGRNIIDKGEQVCPMVLLIKDHKAWSPESNSPPPSRPVISGNCGLNCHLSELISHVLEPITRESPGPEIDSTTEMLSKIDMFNESLLNGKATYQVSQCSDHELRST